MNAREARQMATQGSAKEKARSQMLRYIMARIKEVTTKGETCLWSPFKGCNYPEWRIKGLKSEVYNELRSQGYKVSRQRLIPWWSPAEMTISWEAQK